MAPGNDTVGPQTGSSVVGLWAARQEIVWRGRFVGGRIGRDAGRHLVAAFVRNGGIIGRRLGRLGGLRRPRGPRRVTLVVGISLGDGLEQHDRARDRRIERPDRPAHRDPDHEIAAAADRRRKALALAADDDRQRPSEIRLAGGQWGAGLRTDDTQAAEPQIRQGARQVVDGTKKQVLDCSRGRLHGRRAQRRLAMRRKDHAVHPGGFRASQQRADVLGILERVEGQHEGRLGPLDAPGQDFIQGCEPARADHKGDSLVAVEPGHGRERAALHFDDRDPQARGVQDQTLERLAALGDDEQPNGRSSGNERLFHWAPAGHQLFALVEEIVCGRRWATIAELGRVGLPAGRAGPRRPRAGAGSGGFVWRTRTGVRRARGGERRPRANGSGPGVPWASGSVERRPVLAIERRPIRAIERRPARATALEGLAIIAIRPSWRARPVLESPARLGAIVR